MQSGNNNIERPVALVILDGWGYAPKTDGNAIAVAHTPNYDEICRSFPMTTLTAAASGTGCSPEMAGDPEVGHLHMGTGRAAVTETTRIANAITSGEFMSNAVLIRAFEKAREKGSDVHLIGMISDAGIHSSTNSLFALLRMAKAMGSKNVFIHGILDGLDVQPRTADVYTEALEIKLADIGVGRIATLCGRFFAMDAGEHWERTARAFTMLVHAEGERANDPVSAIRNSFLRGISDEFIAPIVIEESADTPVARIKNGDLVVFFNHRADGMRQIVRSLCIPEGESGAKPDVDTVCLTEYDRAFNLPVAFRQDPERNTLASVLSESELPILKVTEQARVQHLTSCFDGGVDEQNHHEERVFIAGSERIVDIFPESGSFKITDKLLRGIEAFHRGVNIANLPAAALMAETGNLERTREAIQYIDTCIGGIYDKVKQAGGVLLITSSYGTCEEMVHSGSDEPNFAPTANPVPFHYIDFSENGVRLREDGLLADVAPTILGVLGIEKPKEMTGEDLRIL